MNDWANITKNLYRSDNYSRIKEVHDFILEQLHLKKGQKILDIGCGDGSLLKKIKGSDLYGIDLSPEQVAIAKSTEIDAVALNIDAQSLPYGNDFFDSIICSEVIEHVLLPDKLLQEAYRVLKKDGIFIITTPNLASFGRRLLLLCNKNPFIENSPLEDNAVGHLRYFIYPTLKALIEKYNFYITKRIGDLIIFGYPSFLQSRKIARMFPSLARTIMIVVKKRP